MAAPTIVSRAQWGAQPARPGCTRWSPGQPTGHTGHWEGSGGHTDHSQCAAEVRSIQAYHFSKGYFDIAYNWIVCIHGVIFEGRPVGAFESAAQRGGNPLRVAICGMWGPTFPFSSAAQAAFAWLVTNDPANSRGRLIGHADEPTCATGCPGDIEPWIRAGQWHSAPVTPSPQPQPAPAPHPVPPAGFHHPTLHVGSVGPAVMELQLKMVAGAGQNIVVDGNFGLHTAAAVENIQRISRIAVDGVAGPITWNYADFYAALRAARR